MNTDEIRERLRLQGVALRTIRIGLDALEVQTLASGISCARVRITNLDLVAVRKSAAKPAVRMKRQREDER